MKKVLKDIEAALKKSYARRLATFAKPAKSLAALAKLGDVPEEVALPRGTARPRAC